MTLDWMNGEIMRGWPGGPHLLLPFISEAIWTLCFLYSTILGPIAFLTYLGDLRRLKRAGINGEAQITAINAVREGGLRCIVSPPALALGLWAFSLPDTPITTGRAALVEAVFLVIAIGYALIGFWRFGDRRRLLEMIEKEAAAGSAKP